MSEDSLYFKIGELVNHTFGDTGPGSFYKSGQKVNLAARTDSLIEAKYVSLVTFTSDRNLDSLMQKYRNEGYKLMEAALKKLSEDFKEKHGSSLSFEFNTETARDEVEYAHYNIYNSTRRAFYKLACLVEVKVDGNKKEE